MDISALESLKTQKDLWSYLKETSKPIVLYGMGDGADKILNVCEQKGIPIAGVFASDEFVRKKVFRGFEVMHYADLKATLGSLIILVSFATRLQDMMQKIYALMDLDEVYAPDVPVYGEGIFDSTYFNAHFEQFSRVYSLLADDISKTAYVEVLRYKLTGSLVPLKTCETPIEEAYQTIIRPHEDSVYADIGAYNGDTLLEYMSYAGTPKDVYAFEPDARNYKKLVACAEAHGISTEHLYNIAAWNKAETLTFYARSGRGSAKTTFHDRAKEIQIPADCVDAYLPDHVDFINIDAEGSDLAVIQGMEQTLKRGTAIISCAVYHRNEDMFAIPQAFFEANPHCKIYVRHFPYIPAWDTNVYIVPLA